MRPVTLVVALILSLGMVQSKTLHSRESKPFCPARTKAVCVRSIDECCIHADCPGRVCCSGNCGNKCQEGVSKKTSGVSAISEGCEITPL